MKNISTKIILTVFALGLFGVFGIASAAHAGDVGTCLTGYVYGDGTAWVENNCSTGYTVGLASYKMFESRIETQTLFAETSRYLAPGQSVGRANLSVALPECNAQLDLFIGGTRVPPYYDADTLISYAEVLSKGWCQASTPPPVTPPPVTPPPVTPPPVTPPPVTPPPTIQPGTLSYQCLNNPLRVQLNWTSGVNANSNSIEKGDVDPNDPNRFWGFILQDASLALRTFIDSNVLSGTTYTYRVKYAPSVPSNEVQVTCTNAVAPVAPSVDIKANGADGIVSVVYNAPATITWTSANAVSCLVTPGGYTQPSNSTGVSTGAVTGPMTYNIYCTNSAGQSASDSVMVVPQAVQSPTVTIYATPSVVNQGQTSTLYWTSQNATTCTASGGWSGTKAIGTNQNEVVTPQVTTTYTIICSNATGQTSAPAQTTVTVQQVSQLPTVTITATPSVINQGQTSTLYWTSANATTCLASGGWSGTKAIGANQNEIVVPQVTTTYTIICSNATGQTSAPAQTTVTVQQISQQPTVTIYATPQSINQGQSSTLYWTSANATSCYASSGSWSGTKALSSNEPVQPGGTTTYGITCTNSTGQTAQAQTTVYVNQISNPTVTVTLYANPQTVNQGQSSTLTWSSTNANNCYASGGNWYGTKWTSGNEAVSPSQTTSYTITCTGTNGGQAQAIATVWVNNNQYQQLPTVNLYANPASVTQGQATVLNWTAYNATSCYASGGNWSGTKAVSGSETIYPQGTTTYSITCSNSYGSANDPETVYVGGTSGTYSQITKNVLNRTLNQTTYVSSIDAQSLDVVEFEIRVRNTDSATRTITVQDPLPSTLYYVQGSTSVNGVTAADGITTTGITLYSMNPAEERTIRFRAVLFANVTPGTTITNQANSSGVGAGNTYGTATIYVQNRGTVLGVASIVTGAGDSLLWAIVFGFLTTLLFHFGAMKAGWYDLSFGLPGTAAASAGAPSPAVLVAPNVKPEKPRKIEEILKNVFKRNGLEPPRGRRR